VRAESSADTNVQDDPEVQQCREDLFHPGCSKGSMQARTILWMMYPGRVRRTLVRRNECPSKPTPQMGRFSSLLLDISPNHDEDDRDRGVGGCGVRPVGESRHRDLYKVKRRGPPR